MITREFIGLLVKTMGVHVHTPIDITLSYDPDFDPLAVQMIVSVPGEEEVVWYFSRELLGRGLNSAQPVGSGDVKFRYSGPSSNQLLVCLGNLNGRADLGLPWGEVANFLDETLVAVLPGDECLDDLIDETIEEILGA